MISLHGLSKRDEKEREDDKPKHEIEQYDEEHCDYKCQLRENSIEKHQRRKKGIVQVDDKHVCIATPSKLDRTNARSSPCVSSRSASSSPVRTPSRLDCLLSSSCARCCASRFLFVRSGKCCF